MLKSIATANRVFKIGGVDYTFTPLHLKSMSLIAQSFDAKGLSYEQGVASIYSNDDIVSGIQNAIEFLAILYVGEDKEEFKNNISTSVKDRNELLAVVNALITDSAPDYTFTQKKTLSKKKHLVGWLMIVLAVVGLIHTLDYVSSIIVEVIPNLYNLLLSKFSN